MARKKTDRVAELESGLASLQAQRGDLAARVEKLEAEQTAIDLQDVKGEVARLAIGSAELRTSSRVLDQLDRRIQETITKVAESRADANQAEVERLWPKEKAACEVVVALVDQAAAAFDVLDDIQRQIRHNHGFCQALFPNDLPFRIRRANEYWRVHGYWHADGGTQRQQRQQEKAERERRVAAGLPAEPINSRFVELMSTDKEARREFEKRTGNRIIGKGEEMRVEADPARLFTPGQGYGA